MPKFALVQTLGSKKQVIDTVECDNLPPVSNKGKWLPVITAAPTFDAATQKLEGPVVSVANNRVTETWVVKPLVAAVRQLVTAAPKPTPSPKPTEKLKTWNEPEFPLKTLKPEPTSTLLPENRTQNPIFTRASLPTSAPVVRKSVEPTQIPTTTPAITQTSAPVVFTKVSPTPKIVVASIETPLPVETPSPTPTVTPTPTPTVTPSPTPTVTTAPVLDPLLLSKNEAFAKLLVAKAAALSIKMTWPLLSHKNLVITLTETIMHDITSAITKANNVSNKSTNWGKESVCLNDLFHLLSTVSSHISACEEHYKSLHTAITIAASVSEVKEIQLNKNWPNC